MITTNCPIPFSDSDCVLLAHGSGGRMTHPLISSIFYPAFRNSLLEQDHDGCVFQVETGRIACSTDSFVVDPEGYIIRRDLRGGEVLDYLSEVVTEYQNEF